jgi:hypothetical protein
MDTLKRNRYTKYLSINFSDLTPSPLSVPARGRKILSPLSTSTGGCTEWGFRGGGLRIRF